MAMTNNSSSKRAIASADDLVYYKTSWHDYDDEALTKMPIVLTSCGPEVPRKCSLHVHVSPHCSLHVSPHCSSLTDFPPLAHDCRTARPAEIPAGPCRRIYSTSGGGREIEKSSQWIFLAIGGQRFEAMRTEKASICCFPADDIQDCIDPRRPVRSWPSLDEAWWQLPRLHDQATTGQTVARPSYDRPGLAMAGHDRPGLAIAGNDRPGLAMTGHDRPGQGCMTSSPGCHRPSWPSALPRPGILKAGRLTPSLRPN